MTAHITPSKQVRAVSAATRRQGPKLTRTNLQAASAIEAFKMESPVKKLDFSAAGKENTPFDADLATLEAEIDAKHHEKTAMDATKKGDLKAAVPSTVKPEEADEPLLQENPQRFVLFPIKYHEVRLARRHA